MRWPRVKTIILHSFFHLTHSMETWIDLFWFPTISVVVFGYLAQYLGKLNQTETASIVAGYIMWEIIRSTQFSITIGMMFDIWSKNFSSLFVSPLTIFDFIIGQILAAFFKAILVLGVLVVLSMLLFHFSFFDLGWTVGIYFFLLSMFGWATGIFIMGLIFRFGTDIQSLAWGLVFLFQPISAIVYPVSALPASFRWVAYISPVTFLTESMRAQLNQGEVLVSYLGWALGLNILYLIGAWFFMTRQFSWARKTGAFARMEG